MARIHKKQFIVFSINIRSGLMGVQINLCQVLNWGEGDIGDCGGGDGKRERGMIHPLRMRMER